MPLAAPVAIVIQLQKWREHQGEPDTHLRHMLTPQCKPLCTVLCRFAPRIVRLEWERLIVFCFREDVMCVKANIGAGQVL